VLHDGNVQYPMLVTCSERWPTMQTIDVTTAFILLAVVGTVSGIVLGWSTRSRSARQDTAAVFSTSPNGCPRAGTLSRP